MMQAECEDDAPTTSRLCHPSRLRRFGDHINKPTVHATMKTEATIDMKTNTTMIILMRMITKMLAKMMMWQHSFKVLL